jgi:hypothetical protein
VSFWPHLFRDVIRDIAVARCEEELHIERIDQAAHFVPLGVQFRLVITVALDDIDDADDELRLQQVG